MSEFEAATASLEASERWLESRLATIARATAYPTSRVNPLGEMQALGAAIDAACGRREAARSCLAATLGIITDTDLRNDIAAYFGV